MWDGVIMIQIIADDSKASIHYLDSFGTLFALCSIHVNIAAFQRIDFIRANKQSSYTQKNWDDLKEGEGRVRKS